MGALLTWCQLFLDALESAGGLLRGSGQAHSHGSGLNLEIWTFFSICGISLHIYRILEVASPSLVTGSLLQKVEGVSSQSS